MINMARLSLTFQITSGGSPPPPPPSSSSMLVYHVYDKQVLQRDLNAIANAKQYVKISTYLLELSNDPAKSAAYQLGQALQQAKRNGAVIQISFNNDALSSTPRPWHSYTVDYLNNVLRLQNLTDSSSSVRSSSPSVSGYVISNMHTKTIVTESYLRTGSTNLNVNGYTYNLEDTIQIENPRADQSGGEGARMHDVALAYVNSYFVNKTPVKVHSNNPYINFISGDNDVGKYWTTIISRLQKSTCQKAYFSTYTYNSSNATIQQLVQEMIKAKKERGVDVRLVAGSSARSLADYLNQNGVPARTIKNTAEGGGGINHSKLVYMKDSQLGIYVVVGSQNFDGAFTGNTGITVSSTYYDASTNTVSNNNIPTDHPAYSVLTSALNRFNYLWNNTPSI